MIHKPSPIGPLDVIFFHEKESDYYSSLRDFLNFFKQMKIGPAPRFAFIDREGPLLPGLSLKENIYLDSVPSSLSSHKESQLNNLLEKGANTYLIEMYRSIKDLNQLVKDVDHGTRKKVALIKGLLQDSDYLLLNRPEKYLNESDLKLFLKAFEFHAASNNQVIFLSSNESEIWAPFTTKVAVKEKNQKFKLNVSLRQPSGQDRQKFEVSSADSEGQLTFLYLDEADLKAS